MKRATTTVFRLASLALLLSASAWMIGCDGDDGAPGADGTNGTNGTNGTTGAGYTEALSRGNIVYILDGKRPDGVAFKDTVDFRFSPSSEEYSQLYRNVTGTDQYNQITLIRYAAWDKMGLVQWNESIANTTYSQTAVQFDESNKLIYRYFNFQVLQTSIEFPSENKYFKLSVNVNTNIYYDENGAVTEVDGNDIDYTVSEYKTAINTDGKFNYKVSFTVPASNNSTGNDLKITVVTNALIMESLEDVGPKRTSDGNGRTAGTVAVAKAQMLPLN